MGSLRGSCILWNKFGSLAELQNSEIGPDFSVVNGTPTYEAFKHGNGMRLGAGAVMIRIADLSSLDKNKGLIEYWWKPNFANTLNAVKRMFITAGVVGEISFNCNFRGDITNGLLGLIFVANNFATASQPQTSQAFSSGDSIHVMHAWENTRSPGRYKIFLNNVANTIYFAGRDLDWTSGDFASPIVFNLGAADALGADSVFDNMRIYTEGDDAFAAQVYANKDNEDLPSEGRPLANKYNFHQHGGIIE